MLGEGHVQVYHGVNMEIRSQLVGVHSLLQPCGSQGWKSGPPGQQQVSTQWATVTATYIPNSNELFQSFCSAVSSDISFSNHWLWVSRVGILLFKWILDKATKKKKNWPTLAQSVPRLVARSSRPFTYLFLMHRMLPFLLSFGKNTLMVVFSPLPALSSCMAALVVNINKN